MIFTPLPLSGAYLIDLECNQDNRGFLARYWCEKELSEIGLSVNIAQINNSVSSIKGTLRGLHFQIKYPQGKLLRCLKGKVFDVAVDLRKDSPYYGQWVGEELSEDNKCQLFIPAGFAHGYYVLSETAEITYKCSEIYHPQDEQGLRWDDPDIAINWPGDNPILSEKDKVLPMLADSDFKKSQTDV